MLLFLAGVIEQLDLALEHLQKGDVHNARFGLMLADNAVELMLHQIAKSKSAELNFHRHVKEEYSNDSALERALGRSFDAKVKFAKIEAKFSEQTARTISLLHEFRNEVYHIGLQHEAILPSIANFYFDVACRYLATYEPHSLGWSSNQELPERAEKYFAQHPLLPGNFDDFGHACRQLADACGFDTAEMIEKLADHMKAVVSDQDTCIDIVAGGVYKGQQTTRDQAVIESQTWPLAFSEKGLSFAQERGWTGNRLQLVQWLGVNFPLPFKRDPIPSWTKQVARLRSGQNPHSALANYQSFMESTAEIREALLESAGQVEAEIDAAIDRARGK